MTTPAGALWSYVDPTGGLPPSAWGMLVTALVAALGGALAALRLFGRRLFRFLAAHRRAVPGSFLVAGVGLLMGIWWFGRSAPSQPPSPGASPRVLVLAFDGLDPRLLEEYLAEGRLPNFARLAHDGLYHPLETSAVPQSPVAWSTFITGQDPSRHGVFDFLCRDPATYLPDLTLADRRRLSLPWHGTPFWERPAVARLGFVAQRLPMVFPPPKFNGRVLAGMGVWDVRGTEGTYFYFATKPPDLKDARGMILPLKRAGSLLRGELPGPYRAGQPDTVREPFEVELTPVGRPLSAATSPAAPSSPTAVLRLQRTEYPLHLGRWSDWVQVEFGMGLMGLQRVPAVTRVLLRTEGPEVSLYVAPLNFDPRAPLYPLSHPPKYAAELAGAVGLYATRGMPFDTQAVNDGVLSDDHFLEQARAVTDESEKMLAYELPRFRSGLLFAYFEAADVIQHLFWRGIDPQHPLHDDPETRSHRDAIPRVYEQFDAVLGRARAALGADGRVVVLSDHGFGPFRTSVHLNSVLRELGFLALKGGKPTSGELLRDIDWAHTRAYALGFNAVYLNLAGREGQGVVKPEQAEALARAVAGSLEGWRDPQNGERPIKKVTVQLPASADSRTMPDLVVGYYRGYRASWETALGGVPAATAEPNRRKWSGDHCVDASEVPGVFLSSDQRLDAQSLADVGAAIDRFLATTRPGP